MIGVAFFAFSSYVCLAQAQAQEKELAASPNKRKDEFSENKEDAEENPLTQEVGFGHKASIIGCFTELILDVVWPCLPIFFRTANVNPGHFIIGKSVARNLISRYLEKMAGVGGSGLLVGLSIVVVDKVRGTTYFKS